MTATTLPAYDDWKAPKQDGEIIIWPPPGELIAATRDNHAALTTGDATLIQNVPLRVIRAGLRKWLGQTDDSQLVIGTGHQTELYHAGVWVKHALTNAAAATVDGAAMHFAVDTDAPKHLSIRWPGQQALPITDDPAVTSAAWSGLVDGPTPYHLGQLIERTSKAEWIRDSAIGSVLQSLKQLSLDEVKLSPAIVNATHQLDWSLGLTHHANLLSPMLSTDGYLAFAHHLLSDAKTFASTYNGALGEYRLLTGSTNLQRPMPNLFVSDESVESPFWLDHLATGTRVRPTVFERDGGFVLTLVSGAEFFFDPNIDAPEAASTLRRFLSLHHLRLAPCALTLTTFLRLLVVDNFVHGIGGGRYDQVTDRIFVNYFKLPPPRFAVTTATMFLPEALGRSRVCLPCLAQRGHQLRHRVLGERKRELLDAINAAPRRSAERQTLFFELHRAIRLERTTNPVLRRWQEEMDQGIQTEAENEVLFDRELFYALQPASRLAEMIDRYREAFR